MTSVYQVFWLPVEKRTSTNSLYSLTRHWMIWLYLISLIFYLFVLHLDSFALLLLFMFCGFLAFMPEPCANVLFR